ncbi:helix-turn-helix domain-containing protein [Micromonospora sp. LZ34]
MRVDARDERVLRALLTRPQATVDGVATASGQHIDQVAAALARLSRRGLAARLAGPPDQYTATDPRTAPDALIHRAEQALRRARDAVAELTALFHTARTEPPTAGSVEVVTGHEISRAFVRMQQSARVLADVPLKMHLFDDRLAMVALDLDTPTTRTALMYPSALLEALATVFESCWQRATPLEAAAGEAGLSDEHRQLIALLAAGVKDDMIGRTGHLHADIGHVIGQLPWIWPTAHERDNSGGQLSLGDVRPVY